MNKSILALAVAASALTGVAQADGTTLYGSVRMAYNYTEEGSLADNKDDALSFDGVSKFGNAGSRFGIKGEESLGNGLTAFYKYENRIGANLDTNKLYVGLKGGFGSVSFGKQATPVDELGNYSDPFNALTPGARVGLDLEKLDKDEIEVTGTDFAETSADNSLVYWSPDMSGFQVGAAIVADGYAEDKDGKRTDNHDHVDWYQIAAKYDANGFFAGLGYTSTNGLKKEESVVSLGLGYGNDQFEVGLKAERADDGSKSNPITARLSGLYNINEADAVYAGVAMYDYDAKYDDENLDKDYEVSLGYQHKFSPRTKIWAEYSYVDVQNEDSSAVSLGLRTDF